MQQSTYLRWRWQQRHGNSLQHGAITARDQCPYSRWRWQQSYGNSLQHGVITARNQSPHHADAGNVRQRHSGLAIVSSDVCGVTRVYPQTIFRPRKLRLAELIVGWHDFYFIPGHPNPTVASANRYLWLNYRVHLLRTNNKKTRSISNMHERKERFAQ